ncbi:MAG TPA: DUF3365 domain-containing protein [Planctomycetaceae bacterium]|nr:DUF3365 domain-containing protein [Planctomycetaceae bacterium]
MENPSDRLTAGWKIAALCFVLFATVWGLLLAKLWYDQREVVRQQFIERARHVAIAAESTRESMTRKWTLGVFETEDLKRWARDGQMDKVLEAVPVVAALRIARAKAEELGCELRVPALEPRNPKNEPDELEAKVLRLFRQEAVDEYCAIDEETNSVRYFRPVRVTPECLLCHGDPGRSDELWANTQGLDPTGHRMENWQVGDVRAAFEVIQPLDEADALMAQSLWRATAFCVLGMVLAGGGACWALMRFLSRRMAVLVSSIRRLTEGDMSVDTSAFCESRGCPVGVALGALVAKLREIVTQAKAVARGDFSVQVRPTNDRDELGQALSEMTESLRNVARICQAVADGDYSEEVQVKSENDLLAKAANRMIAKLREVSEQINAAGVRMVAASREQAEGARNQAAAMAEMTSSVTELAASAKQVSESGGTVAEQASLAAQECEAGTASVQEAVKSIKGIQERVEKIAQHMLDLGRKSQQITGILDIITELSEQTNLLSLNASIEAAGAGEAGKRFAVVASEIRSLAERATQSTTEIRSLIDEIQETTNAAIMATEEGAKAAQEGVRLTVDVERSFEQIAERVAATAQSAKAIEMACRQQATAIDQIEETVQSLDSAAQQSEETAQKVDVEARALLESARKLRAAGPTHQAV